MGDGAICFWVVVSSSVGTCGPNRLLLMAISGYHGIAYTNQWDVRGPGARLIVGSEIVLHVLQVYTHITSY